MKIEFLGMKDGCPNTPRLWQALHEALDELQWKFPIDSLDVNELSRERDPRAGFGSPTILVDGRDLFGVTPSNSLEPVCRYYRGGLPGAKDIIRKLQAIAAEDPTNVRPEGRLVLLERPMLIQAIRYLRLAIPHHYQTLKMPFVIEA